MTTALEPSVGQQFLFLLYFQTIYTDPSLEKEGVRIVPSYKGHFLDSCTLGETFEFGHCCTVFCRKKDGHVDFFLKIEKDVHMLYTPSGFHTGFLFPTVLRRGACFLFSVEPERKEGRMHSGEQGVALPAEPKVPRKGMGVLNGRKRGRQRQLFFISTS